MLVQLPRWPVRHASPDDSFEQVVSVDASEVVVDAGGYFRLLISRDFDCRLPLQANLTNGFQLVLSGGLLRLFVNHTGLVGIENAKDALSRTVLVSNLEDELLGIIAGAELLIDRVVEPIESFEGNLREITLLLHTIGAPLEDVDKEPARVHHGCKK